MKTFEERIEEFKNALESAEAVVIGAGAGFSDAAGIKYVGKRFTDNFQDFIKKYNMEDLYTSSFYPFKTQEERWAYWAKHVSLNRFETPATKLYTDLFDLVRDKNYFIITTNVEHQFWKANFPNEKIFATQGDYGYIQCAKGCHNKLYDNDSLVANMISATKDCKIPSSLVPKCPVCGGEMDINVRKDRYFVQGEDWDIAYNNYEKFIENNENKKIVFIELGVGYNTPGIIRYPFEQMTNKNDKAVLIRLNKDYPQGPIENKSKTISFTEDMMEVIERL
ncbi:MAG: hypothetical protein KBE24_09025 [Fusobacteriaceae bacterium]|nr:hypothetical protein [Fusobacteriaceae bacterium]